MLSSLEKWQCCQLDALALNCCQAGGLLASPACVKISKLLLGCHKQLLSLEASISIFLRFLDSLRRCQGQGAGCRPQDLEAAILVVEVLDEHLFSGGVPESHEALEVWSELVYVVAGLAWQDGTQSRDSSSLERKWESLLTAASKLWALGVPMRDLHELIPLQVYNIVEKLAGLSAVMKWNRL